MKKFLLLFFTLCLALPVMASLEGNGYYRVQNFVTKRYCYVSDDKGNINIPAGTADVSAILLFKDFLRAASDPSTIIYISQYSGKQYELEAQGAKVSQFMGGVYPYVSLAPKNRDTYVCYGKKSGMVKYLGDVDITNDDQGEASVEATGDYREWYIEPVGTADNNYFGVKPTLTAGNAYWHPLYTDFPMTPCSSGVEIYTISRIEAGMAVLKKATGAIPGGTPCLVKCTGMNPSANKITVGGSSSAAGTNLLGGVYFDNALTTHYNRTKYDKNTMRVLGVDSQGHLAFVTGSIDFLPANQSYLKVPAGTQSSLRVVTEEEFQELRYEPNGITVSPTSITKGAGETFTVTATLSPSDARTTLTWTSSNTSVATVDQNGKVTCVAKGTADITAKTSNGYTAKCTVTVQSSVTSVTVAPATLTLKTGATQKLSATVSPSDVPDKTLVWSSSNTSVATVDASGKVTAKAAGTASITATAVNGVSGSCALTVENPTVYPASITVTPATATVTEGDVIKLSAKVLPEDTTDKTVTWSTSSPSTASVAQDGTVTALKPGTVTITASIANLSSTCKITIEKRVVHPESIELDRTALDLSEGDRYTLTATVLPADASYTTVAWNSSNTSVATVANGTVTALAEGECDIKAVCGEAYALCHVKVSKRYIPVTSLRLNVTSLTLTEGKTAMLYASVSPSNATDAEVTWSTSDGGIATVEDGLVAALAEGTAEITAKAGDCSAVCTVTVVTSEVPVIEPSSIMINRTHASLSKGETLQLTATVYPSNADDKSVVWSSDDTDVATVSETGLVTATGGGTASVTATTVNGLTASCALTVNVTLEGIEVLPSEYSAIEGAEFDLVVVPLPADAALPAVVWSSSDNKVVTVDSSGHCRVLTSGTASVKAATYDSRFESICIVTGLSGIAELLGESGRADVHDIHGRLILRDADSEALSRLAPGLYIIGGRKTLLN